VSGSSVYLTRWLTISAGECDLSSGLADPTRRRILVRLSRDGEDPVTEIAKPSGCRCRRSRGSSCSGEGPPDRPDEQGRVHMIRARASGLKPAQDWIRSMRRRGTAVSTSWKRYSNKNYWGKRNEIGSQHRRESPAAHPSIRRSARSRFHLCGRARRSCSSGQAARKPHACEIEMDFRVGVFISTRWTSRGAGNLHRHRNVYRDRGSGADRVSR